VTRVLLDTHAFLWWDLDDERLSPHANEVMRNGRNQVFVSAGSIWEVAIKASKGRLELPTDVRSYVVDRLRRYRWTPLPIDASHAVQAATLPPIHGDPFDRVLVAQAQLESIPIVTIDPAITRYDVETIW
jgi:PIN domain nuclease of toxin-antitoxin system